MALPHLHDDILAMLRRRAGSAVNDVHDALLSAAATIERAIALAHDGRTTLARNVLADLPEVAKLEDATAAFEKAHVRTALAQYGGDVTAAARALGILPQRVVELSRP